MRHIESYCAGLGVGFPKILIARPGDILSQGALARADFPTWSIFVRPGIEVSEWLIGHELAHLLTSKDGHDSDSILHGPKFRARELEIENYIRMETRRELRMKNAE